VNRPGASVSARCSQFGPLHGALQRHASRSHNRLTLGGTCSATSNAGVHTASFSSSLLCEYVPTAVNAIRIVTVICQRCTDRNHIYKRIFSCNLCLSTLKQTGKQSKAMIVEHNVNCLSAFPEETTAAPVLVCIAGVVAIF